jgi:PAS domain S-box-containing protein
LKELNDSRERFEKAFNNSPALMGISVLETGVYVDVNRVFLDVLGFSRDEVIGKTSKELGVFTDYRERLRIADILKKDGTVRNVEVVSVRALKANVSGCFPRS